MARIHNEIHRGGFLSAIKTALGGSTSLGGIERFSETLQPVMDAWARDEWAYLRRELAYAKFVASGAVAARFSSIELTMATNLRTIAVLFLTRTANGALGFTLDAGNAIAANPVTSRGVRRDGRMNQGTNAQSSQLLITAGDLAAGIGTTFEGWRHQTTSGSDIPAWVITPGSRLVVAGSSVNTAVEASFAWYERDAMPGELD